MKTYPNLLILAVLLLAAGCSGPTPEALRQALGGNEFWLLSAANDTISLVEFRDSCARHFDWDAFIIDEWSVKEADGELLLNFDLHDYEPVSSANGSFEFRCAKTGERLAAASEARFDTAALLGTWLDAHYAGLPASELVPCPNGGAAQMPALIFEAGSCTVQAFCEAKTRPFSVNALTKTVWLGDPCDGQADQLRIKKLTADQLVVDMKFKAQGKWNLNLGKMYVRG